MTPEDKLADAAEKVAAAIDRNTEQVRQFKSQAGSVGLWLFLLWAGLCVFGCPRAKAAPITTTPGDPCGATTIRTEVVTIAHFNGTQATIVRGMQQICPMQPWYTVDIPRDGGVYPLEVYAPSLPRLWPGPQIVELGEPPRLEPPSMETPEPGTGWMITLGILLVVVYVAVIILGESQKQKAIDECNKDWKRYIDKLEEERARKALEEDRT